MHSWGITYCQLAICKTMWDATHSMGRALPYDFLALGKALSHALSLLPLLVVSHMLFKLGTNWRWLWMPFMEKGRVQIQYNKIVNHFLELCRGITGC